ncbi:mycothiol transferase [Micromonospora chersina]
MAASRPHRGRGGAAHARPIEREAESLDVSAYHARWAEDVSLRLVMLHEYARHNGHVDFLREAVDGIDGV